VQHFRPLGCHDQSEGGVVGEVRRAALFQRTDDRLDILRDRLDLEDIRQGDGWKTLPVWSVFTVAEEQKIARQWCGKMGEIVGFRHFEPVCTRCSI